MSVCVMSECLEVFYLYFCEVCITRAKWFIRSVKNNATLSLQNSSISLRETYNWAI